MKNGILGPNDGFEIAINGVMRSFRDLKEPAFEAARVLKQRHPGDLVEVVVCATGARIVMLEDGRTG